jgi:hypothetical protein
MTGIEPGTFERKLSNVLLKSVNRQNSQLGQQTQQVDEK